MLQAKTETELQGAHEFPISSEHLPLFGAKIGLKTCHQGQVALSSGHRNYSIPLRYGPSMHGLVEPRVTWHYELHSWKTSHD